MIKPPIAIPCPAGATLTSLGTWHNKKGEANETSFRFKTYRTDACKTCALRSQCTKLNKRIIQRSEYQDAVDINNNNIKQNPQYYKRRQAIVEHPFGTIKRHFGFTYFTKRPSKSKWRNAPDYVLLQLYANKKYTGL
ncbi:MAG: transposase [Chitinophagaceae bacterium]|nr:transposase [Chitinophagaceae bacterium]